MTKLDLSEKGKFYFKNALKMFGPLTEAFLCFQQDLDAKQTPVISQLHPEDKYFSFKENDICICSLFIEYLKIIQINQLNCNLFPHSVPLRVTE